MRNHAMSIALASVLAAGALISIESTSAQATTQTVAATSAVAMSKHGVASLTAVSVFNARIANSVMARSMRAKSAVVAKTKVGARYRYGSQGPHAFDCSGLTLYVWKKAGKKLPHSSKGQYRKVKRIGAAHRQPGDLVFFFRGGVRHVGIYVGNNKMVSAIGRGKGVRLESLNTRWHKRHITGYGRVA